MTARDGLRGLYEALLRAGDDPARPIGGTVADPQVADIGADEVPLGQVELDRLVVAVTHVDRFGGAVAEREMRDVSLGGSPRCRPARR